MYPRSPMSHRTDTLCPYTSPVRSPASVPPAEHWSVRVRFAELPVAIATPEVNGFGFPAPHWLFATLRSATEALRPVAGFPQAVPASVSDISPIAQQRRSLRPRIPEARHAYRRCCRHNPVPRLQIG